MSQGGGVILCRKGGCYLLCRKGGVLSCVARGGVILCHLRYVADGQATKKYEALRNSLKVKI